MSPVLAIALVVGFLVSCGGAGSPPTLHLGGLTMREDSYRAEVRRLVQLDDEICRTWLQQGVEPVQEYRNIDSRKGGANLDDVGKALLIFREECRR